jgi:hypothetical protein
MFYFATLSVSQTLYIPSDVRTIDKQLIGNNEEGSDRDPLEISRRHLSGRTEENNEKPQFG